MALGDILGGAGAGALGGSSLGPFGALGGGLLGALLGAFGKKKGLFQEEDELKQFDRYSPEQQELLSQLMAALTGKGKGPTGGILGTIFGEKGFDAYKQPALRDYFENIVPGIAERFTQAGAQRSSGFQNALARSGENLATRLGEMRSQQQQQLLGSLLGPALSSRYDQVYQPGGPTGLGSLLGGLAPSLGKIGGSQLGNLLAGNIFG